MKYNNQWVIDNKKSDFLFFWGNDISYPYSQWQDMGFQQEGRWFYTAEHWMMFNKAVTMNDLSTADAVLHERDPAKVKAMGRKIPKFDSELWDYVKYKIVVQGSIYKFAEPSRKLQLLATGNKVIVEASPFDPIWGIGLGIESPAHKDPAKWKGENLLGYALMEARDWHRVKLLSS